MNFWYQLEFSWGDPLNEKTLFEVDAETGVLSFIAELSGCRTRQISRVHLQQPITIAIWQGDSQCNKEML